MLFDRQRLLLSLLDALGGKVPALDFQKLLFLYTREEAKPTYDFVPYKYGGFSFTSYADKRRLIDRGYLADDERHWRLTESGRGEARKGGGNRQAVETFARRGTNLRGDALVAEVYRRFPYYATRSEIADRVLGEDREAKEAVARARPLAGSPGLFTIGYEGRSLEAYLNRLLVAGVSLLCDVRRNPLSRKYGFSKGTLANACLGLGIRYEHLPQLGIASERRKGLRTLDDYEALFAEYERWDLPGQGDALGKIAAWVAEEGRRVALTCFESEASHCHRHCVAEELVRQFGAKFRPVHL